MPPGIAPIPKDGQNLEPDIMIVSMTRYIMPMRLGDLAESAKIAAAYPLEVVGPEEGDKIAILGFHRINKVQSLG